MKNFEKVFPLLIKDEGEEYTDTPGDNGGPTKYGITLTDVKRFIKRNATSEDVRSLSLNQAKNIYKLKYWDALSCDDLPAGVDYTCFDYGVNSGLSRPRKALQQFKYLSGTKLIDAINNERTAFLKGLAASQKHDEQFLTGWLNRVERVRNYSKKLTKDNLSGPTVGSGIVLSGVFLSQFFHQYEYLIIDVTLAVIVGTAIHFLINKGK